MGSSISKKEGETNDGNLEDNLVVSGYFDNWNYYKEYEYIFF